TESLVSSPGAVASGSGHAPSGTGRVVSSSLPRGTGDANRPSTSLPSGSTLGAPATTDVAAAGQAVSSCRPVGGADETDSAAPLNIATKSACAGSPRLSSKRG